MGLSFHLIQDPESKIQDPRSKRDSISNFRYKLSHARSLRSLKTQRTLRKQKPCIGLNIINYVQIFFASFAALRQIALAAFA
jgi:hypothetical protein